MHRFPADSRSEPGNVQESSPDTNGLFVNVVVDAQIFVVEYADPLGHDAVERPHSLGHRKPTPLGPRLAALPGQRAVDRTPHRPVAGGINVSFVPRFTLSE